MPDETKTAAKPAAPTREERIQKIAAERSALCGGALGRDTLIEVATRQVDHDDSQAAADAAAAPAPEAPKTGNGKGGK